MSSDVPTDWTSKVAFMRDQGLTSAKWSTVLDPIGCKSVEVLSEAVCGPAPIPQTDEDREDPAKQLSPQERVRRERIAQRELASRSSGGPRPRLDAEG